MVTIPWLYNLGIPWWSCLAIIIGTSGVVVHETTLSTWGSIWAIVAGVVTSLLFLYGVGRWAWNRLTARDIRRGLQTAPYSPPIAHVPEGGPADGLILETVGFSVANVSLVASRFAIGWISAQ